MILNKTRYVTYRTFWDRVASSEAESDFEREHVKQNGKYDKNNVRHVRVSDNTKMTSANY